MNKFMFTFLHVYRFLCNAFTKTMHCICNALNFLCNAYALHLQKLCIAYAKAMHCKHLIFDDYEKMIDDCILLQCTGLKDRNGKLIYEGDIVTIFHSEMYKGVIKYNQDWVSFWIDGKGIAYNALNTIRHDYLIKLGDIYTTPELLEEKE